MKVERTRKAFAKSSSANKKLLKTYGMMTLLISNEEMDDIMKIIKLLEESTLLIKSDSKRILKKSKGVVFSEYNFLQQVPVS